MRAASLAVVVLAVTGPIVATEGTAPPPRLHNGQLVTLAGGDETDTALDGVRSIEVGPDGTVYVAEHYGERLRRIDPDGTMETIEGVGTPAPGEPESPDSFLAPYSTAVAPDGSVVVASELGISRIDPSGEVTPITGIGDNGDPDDGDDTDGRLAADIRLVRSNDIAIDGAGAIYFADPVTARIRKIDTAGVLSTVAGGGQASLREGEGQLATSASLGTVAQLDVDSQGNLYFMIEYVGVVFKVDAAGALTVVTGTAIGLSGDGGPASEAALSGAYAITVDAEDNLFIADGNNRIRMVDPTGVITTIGPRIPTVEDIAVGPTGDIYLASTDRVDLLVRSGEPAAQDDESGVPDAGESRWAADEPGTIKPVTEAGSDATATGLAVDGAGTLLLADGEHLATAEAGGSLEPIPAQGGALAAAPALTTARAVATTTAGDIYAVIGAEVVRVYPDGAIVTVAGGGPEGAITEDGQNALTAALDVTDIAVGPDDELYIADAAQSSVYALEPDGTITVHADLGGGSPGGLAVGPDGTAYVAMPERDEVVSGDSNRALITVAGTSSDRFEDTDIGDGGSATQAVVINPQDVAVDSGGNLYVSTALGIRRVDPDGIITTAHSTANEAAGTLASGDSQVSHLAIGPHDDLYFFEAPGMEVKVIVRPGEIAAPLPWPWAIGSAGAVIVVAGTLLVIRRRKRKEI